MGISTSKYRKYSRHLIKEDESRTDSFPGEWVIPLAVVRDIVQYAIGDVFPSPWYDNISRVCRLWCRLSIMNIRRVEYRYPYLYDSRKCIAGCEIIARWLTPANHYNIHNSIEAVSLEFGVDPLGFVMLCEKLSVLSSLRSLKIHFLCRNMTKERLASVFTLVKKNKSIRRLDISGNYCDSRLCSVIHSVFSDSVTTRHLREFHYANAKINGFQFNECLLGLIECPSLRGINFSGNRIDHTDIEITLGLLSASKYLKYIDLSFNRFNAETILLLINTCVNNKAIKKLNVTPYKVYSLQLVSNNTSNSNNNNNNNNNIQPSYSQPSQHSNNRRSGSIIYHMNEKEIQNIKLNIQCLFNPKIKIYV